MKADPPILDYASPVRRPAADLSVSCGLLVYGGVACLLNVVGRVTDAALPGSALSAMSFIVFLVGMVLAGSAWGRAARGAGWLLLLNVMGMVGSVVLIST